MCFTCWLCSIPEVCDSEQKKMSFDFWESDLCQFWHENCCRLILNLIRATYHPDCISLPRKFRIAAVAFFFLHHLWAQSRSVSSPLMNFASLPAGRPFTSPHQPQSVDFLPLMWSQQRTMMSPLLYYYPRTSPPESYWWSWLTLRGQSSHCSVVFQLSACFLLWVALKH